MGSGISIAAKKIPTCPEPASSKVVTLASFLTPPPVNSNLQQNSLDCIDQSIVNQTLADVKEEDTPLSSIDNHVKQDPVKIQETLFFGFSMPFNEIKIEGKIGKGSFGQVYRATFKGHRVAVKELFLPLYQAEQNELLQDFQKEVKIVSILYHPNIVQFYGSVSVSPHFCLVTELCEGSVVDLLLIVGMKRVNVTWKICLEIALGAAKAILYLHTLTPQILHRDIKAENLLLTNKFICKLTDFGLSRMLNDPNVNLQMTLCGTPFWVAPEVFRGEPYSSSVDVYAFGIVLWELFCFKKPYENQDAVNLPYLVALDHLRPPLLQHIPPHLATLMANCWNPDASVRPHFDTIVTSIENALHHDSVENIVEPRYILTSLAIKDNQIQPAVVTNSSLP